MTSLSQRQTLMLLVDEAVACGARASRACHVATPVAARIASKASEASAVPRRWRPTNLAKR